MSFNGITLVEHQYQ